MSFVTWNPGKAMSQALLCEACDIRKLLMALSAQ